MDARAGEDSRPVVLFDGGCGLCHRGVRFILRHERGPTLRFAALDSAFARETFARAGIVAAPDSFAYADGDRVVFKSEAACAVAKHLRAPWCRCRAGRILPRAWRDALYDFVARRRLRWFGRTSDACPVADAASRKRFVA